MFNIRRFVFASTVVLGCSLFLLILGIPVKSVAEIAQKVKQKKYASKQNKIVINSAFNGSWIGILSPYKYGSNKLLFNQLNNADFEEVNISGIKHIQLNLLTSGDVVSGETRVDDSILAGWIIDTRVISKDEIILTIQCAESYKSRVRLKLLGSKNLRGILVDGIIFHNYESIEFYSYLIPFEDTNWPTYPYGRFAPYTRDVVDPGRPGGGRPGGGRPSGIDTPGRPGGGRPGGQEGSGRSGGKDDSGRPGGNVY